MTLLQNKGMNAQLTEIMRLITNPIRTTGTVTESGQETGCAG